MYRLVSMPVPCSPTTINKLIFHAFTTHYSTLRLTMRRYRGGLVGVCAGDRRLLNRRSAHCLGAPQQDLFWTLRGSQAESRSRSSTARSRRGRSWFPQGPSVDRRRASRFSLQAKDPRIQEAALKVILRKNWTKDRHGNYVDWCAPPYRMPGSSLLTLRLEGETPDDLTPEIRRQRVKEYTALTRRRRKSQ